MGNTVTDTLGIVTTWTAPGSLVPRSQTLQPNEGFSFQVFAANGSYKGAVNDTSASMRLAHGDTVLRVNLGQRFYAFTGQVITADRNVRDYRVNVVICVSDPKTFAFSYRLDCDPLLLTQGAMQGSVSRWAQQTPGPEVTFDQVRLRIEEGAEATARETGFTVVRIEECVVELSVQSVKMQRILQDERVARARAEFQARRQEERLAQESRDEQAKRIQIDLAARLKDTIDLRGAIFNTMLQGERQRLQKYLDQGATWKNIQEHDPAMFGLLSQLFAPPGDQHLVLPAIQVDVSPSTPAKLDSEGAGLFWEPRLGARLVLVGLTPDQLRVAQGRRRDVRHAFRVVEVDQAGSAAVAGVRVDDVIIQVNDQRLTSDQTVDTLIAQQSGNDAISLAILRGAQFMTIKLKSMP